MDHGRAVSDDQRGFEGQCITALRLGENAGPQVFDPHLACLRVEHSLALVDGSAPERPEPKDREASLSVESVEWQLIYFEGVSITDRTPPNGQEMVEIGLRA